jgi:hypothetical protein
MTLTEDGELVQVTQSIENIERAYRARADSFFVELKRLRKVCAHAVDPGFATHPNYDHAKHLCAFRALGLMRELSDGKITGTKDSAGDLRQIIMDAITETGFVTIDIQM